MSTNTRGRAGRTETITLLAKLGSIAVHADEFFSAGGHDWDRVAILSLLQDPEVVEWISAMGVVLPAKRSR